MPAELWIGVAALTTVALWLLFSGALPEAPPPPEEPRLPQPILVDLALIRTQIELTMRGMENDFRTRQLIHEAEGARRAREAIARVLQEFDPQS